MCSEEQQQDNHIWLTVNGEGWAIREIRPPILHLWRGYWPNLEFAHMDMRNINFDLYCERAADWIEKGIW